MHALAITLAQQGYHVTGSDDEIYNPSLSRLQEAGLAPDAVGWDASRIEGVDSVIVGMHARVDNPELIAAKARGIPIHSFPSYIAEVAKDKQQVVITGSHGKTTTTAMIMYCLRAQGIPFDYLVGADIAGFDGMVQLSDAPLMVIEGDEYLSSPIDRRPKFSHFDPGITVMTGIAWDHINVFPTKESYVQLFEDYVTNLSPGARLIYYQADATVRRLCQEVENSIGYQELTRSGSDSVAVKNHQFPVSIIGRHNLQNMAAAYEVCQQLGVFTPDFFAVMRDFTGADRRLQVLRRLEEAMVFYDFAHAPSKVRATVAAVKEWYGQRTLIACLELHTYSSLSKDFLPEYKQALSAADVAIVYYSPHTFAIKKMDVLEPADVKVAFDRSDIEVYTDKDKLEQRLSHLQQPNANLLLMSSGRFDGLSVGDLWS